MLTDLAAEGAALEALVEHLDEAGWRTPTPASGWDIATQIAHLAWTDEVAIVAATDKEKWDEVVLEAIADPTGYVDAHALEGGTASGTDLLARWRQARSALQEVLRGCPEGHKMPWFGPPMSPTSMATARFMETWAHSLDVAEASGSSASPPTGSATSPTSAYAPATTPSRSTPSTPGRGVPGRAALAVRRALGVGSGGGEAVGPRPRP